MTERFKGFSVVGWPLGQFSERIVVALVKVEPGVPADIEELAAFVDGDNAQFGYRVEVAGVGDADWQIPKIRIRPDGSKYISKTLSFGKPSDDKARTRYYEVAVFRD